MSAGGRRDAILPRFSRVRSSRASHASTSLSPNFPRFPSDAGRLPKRLLAKTQTSSVQSHDTNVVKRQWICLKKPDRVQSDFYLLLY